MGIVRGVVVECGKVGLGGGGDRQAVGKKGDEQMRFAPLGLLIKNGPQTQVAFERAERFLDVAELHVTTPDQFRIVGRKIGP